MLRRVGSESLDFMRIRGRFTLTSVAFVWTQRPSFRLSPSRILPTFGGPHGGADSSRTRSQGGAVVARMLPLTVGLRTRVPTRVRSRYASQLRAIDTPYGNPTPIEYPVAPSARAAAPAGSEHTAAILRILRMIFLLTPTSPAGRGLCGAYTEANA